MAKPATRILVVEVIFGLMLVGVLARAAQIQLVEGRSWTEEARAQLLVRRQRGARFTRRPGDRRRSRGRGPLADLDPHQIRRHTHLNTSKPF